jgi:hypothetical protein
MNQAYSVANIDIGELVTFAHGILLTIGLIETKYSS